MSEDIDNSGIEAFMLAVLSESATAADSEKLGRT